LMKVKKDPSATAHAGRITAGHEEKEK